MIELKQVSKSYGRKQALEKVDLALRPGEIVGLFGENGAGKTTLMKCILDFCPIRAGSRLTASRSRRRTSPALVCHERAFLLPESHGGARTRRFTGCTSRLQRKALRRPDGILRAAGGKALRHFSTGQKNQFDVILSLSQGRTIS
jgi:ABC-2 type transport system ATP-binding protein